jgi:hypothetical protein
MVVGILGLAPHSLNDGVVEEVIIHANVKGVSRETADATSSSPE